MLTLVTQERELISEEVDFIKAKGVDGEFGVLTGHSPFISLLDPGELVVRKGESLYSYYVSGGVAEVLPKSVIILANTVERADEIDEQLARRARENAEEALKKPISEIERRTYLLELKRESVRLSIVARRRSPRHPGQVTEE
ncbi:MAG: ATP synthase F1 subunit epsilon [Nitrospirae bacterium]|nr:ATP synthase F1 subunit epsilon [Nitrospirota bacterium]MCL5285839.1 ATP synthase F1 subunit epsilon [Nitrospirota bacterium]